MPNGNELILLAGPTRDTLPLKEIAGWTHQSKLIFRQDPELMKLVAGIDTTKPLWAAIKMNDCYRQAGVLAAFDSIVGVGEQKDGRLFLDITGKGADAAAVKASVDDLNKGLASTIQEMQQMQAMMPGMKGIVSFLGTIKCEAKATSATFTAVLKDLALAGAASSMVMQEEQYLQPRPVPNQPAPVPVAPPANVP